MIIVNDCVKETGPLHFQIGGVCSDITKPIQSMENCCSEIMNKLNSIDYKIDKYQNLCHIMKPVIHKEIYKVYSTKVIYVECKPTKYKNVDGVSVVIKGDGITTNIIITGEVVSNKLIFNKEIKKPLPYYYPYQNGREKNVATINVKPISDFYKSLTKNMRKIK